MLRFSDYNLAKSALAVVFSFSKNIISKDSVMKKAGIFTTAALAMALSFNTNAQTAESHASVKADTSVVTQGHGGEAQTFSGKNSVVTIYLSGGNTSNYTTEQYADMLQAMFKDTARTEFPTTVSVFYEESGNERPTAGTIYINGSTFDANGGSYENGDGVLTPEQMVAFIPLITSQYAQKMGYASIEETAKRQESFVVADAGALVAE